LIAFGDKEFKKLDMTDAERRDAVTLANQYRRGR
jgi:hypothetical protein